MENSLKTEREIQLNYINFEQLSPKSDIAESEAELFNKAFSYALKDENVFNIAVTGAYGSGKTSLINSYIKYTKNNNRFLNISLATFSLSKDDVNKTDKTPLDCDELPFTTLQKIENSILQQMFYREKGTKLPFSRFKRIRNLSIKLNILLTLFVSVLILFPISFFSEKFWPQLKNMALFSSGIWTGIYCWLFLLSSFLVLFFIIRLCNKVKINKFGFQNIDIEFNAEDKSSLFNRFLDEIVYFFEITKYETIIFEDLDRFKNTEIFIKLRELNTILNNNKNIKQKIKFVYAIKDDIFTDCERTKFFEFIIPVIPVINNQNSCDFLIRIRDKNPNSALSGFDDRFLQDIGLYVNDMRLLKNCINEFQMYDAIINKALYQNSNQIEGHDRKKIFSLVLYKNLYPEDFAKLQNNEGCLYDVLQTKSKVVDKVKKEIEGKIIELETKIENINKHANISITELRKIYILEILRTCDEFVKTKNLELFTDEIFEEIRRTNTIKIPRAILSNRGYYSSFYIDKEELSKTINFRQIEKTIDSEHTYEQREQFIKDNFSNKIQETNRKVDDYRHKLKVLSKLPIAEIINTYNDLSCIKKDSAINYDLVIFLLRNGYIDEYYFDYISHFYEESISKNDQNFLLRLRNHATPIFDSNLNKIDAVINRIGISEWRLDAILNNSLLNYLLENNNEYINDFISTMYEHDTVKTNDSFFHQYTNPDDELLSKFYTLIYEQYKDKKNWFAVFFDSSNYDQLFTFFLLVDIDENDEKFISFIKNNISFLYRKLSNDEKANIKSKFTKYGIKLDLSNEIKDYPIFNVLIENNFYNLTNKNLQLIINALQNENENEITNYLTRIYSINNKFIIEYINQNLDFVVNKVLLPLGLKLNESEEIFISLLESGELDYETKLKLIKNNQVRISNIEKVIEEIDFINEETGESDKSSLWGLLFKNNKVEVTWNNIVAYFNSITDDDYSTLVSFLNTNFDSLPTESPFIQEEQADDEKEITKLIKSFYSKIVLNTETLQQESFEKLMEICPWSYSSLANYKISNEKISYLIKTEKLSISLKNYNGIKDSYFDLLSFFVSNDFEEFLKLFSEEDISIQELELFITSKEISIENKRKLICTNFPEWVNLNDKNILKEIGKIVLEKELRDKIFISVKKIISSIENEAEKIKLLCLQANNLSDDRLRTIVESIGNKYSEMISKGNGFIILELSEENKNLCDILENRHFISSFDLNDKKGIKVWRKRK